MIVEEGKQAVWQHLKECGMNEDIARIAKHFEIKEVNVFTPADGGKLTYIAQRLPKHHKIAVATHPDKMLEAYLKEFRDSGKRK